ncbi:MAG TPA: hypothetical protein VFU30_12180, partial [Gaiellaceae bacterium]|nr:hypothetical protein [Gaiellaceae bacterium]
MYDTLTTSYTFACPVHGETRVRLSRFRRLEQLPGAHHPAVFRVEFDCGCGDAHPGLVSHDDLDWAPLGIDDDRTFVNLMTSRTDLLSAELGDVAATRIKAGEWPWSFFCFPEERPRPVTPSSFRLLAPAADSDRVGLAVRCPVCGKVSVNLVSRAHVDVPFVNDREVGVVGHFFASDTAASIEEFRAELWSESFDARR